MKLSWTQGGLHAEAENSQEREALLIIWQSVHGGDDPKERITHGAGSTLPGGPLVHCQDHIAAS